MEQTIGLKELRQNLNGYINKIRRGRAFIVARHSRPIFKISPPTEERWETVVDFTEIQKDGIDIDDVLARL